MGILQEAKNIALNVMGWPGGVRFVPKDKIQTVTGEETVPTEDHVILWKRLSARQATTLTRDVIIVDRKGKQEKTPLKEIVQRQDQVGQSVTIYLK